MEKIAEKIFTDELIYEGSWGHRRVGSHQSTMILYRDGFSYFIEWDIPDLEESYEIGLETEGKKIVGYDGIMSLPGQAIELLKENGFNTEEVE